MLSGTVDGAHTVTKRRKRKISFYEGYKLARAGAGCKEFRTSVLSIVDVRSARCALVAVVVAEHAYCHLFQVCCLGIEDVGYVKHTTRLENGGERKRMCVEWGHVARARQRQIESRKCQQMTALNSTM